MAKTTYDPEKYYSVQLRKAVEHEGFTLKPGPEPVKIRGDVVTRIADAVESAELTEDEGPHPEPQSETHVQSDR